jgi:hypothetical protein
VSWTTSAQIRQQLRRLWDRGALAASLADGTDLFPLRLRLKGPDSLELAQRFDEVRQWIAKLEQDARHYRIERREIRHRLLGTNTVPARIWVDSLEQAALLINKVHEVRALTALVHTTRERHPHMLSWVAAKPLRALTLVDDWPLLLDIVDWLRQHPRPNVYLRQVDIPGVHSKFIETHRTVLAELLDISLATADVDTTASGVKGFVQRYGFRNKPVRIRLRILDPEHCALPGLPCPGADQDITLTHDVFALLLLPVRHVFITENEVNFLAFPRGAYSMVVFGAGYGFEMLGRAAWMRHCQLHYWGDIDTHGFAILAQLREHFPRARSLLMDRETLLGHALFWNTEPNPETRDLAGLNIEEQHLYNDLRFNRLGRHVRLEQERVRFELVQQAVHARMQAMQESGAKSHFAPDREQMAEDR